jgi:hypothetical protein
MDYEWIIKKIQLILRCFDQESMYGTGFLGDTEEAFIKFQHFVKELRKLIQTTLLTGQQGKDQMSFIEHLYALLQPERVSGTLNHW